MELHQLRYLVAVVETGSFTAAATRERVAQSGVSAQVGKLERELGRPLLDRSRRSIRLTDAGRAVLPVVREVLAAVDRIPGVVDEVTGLVRGEVTMGVIVGCSIPPFLDALAGVRVTYPGLRVGLVEDGSDRLQEGVCDGRLDLALVGWSGDLLPGLASALVVDEPLVAAVPAADELAGRSRVTLERLAGRTVLSLPRGTGVRAAYDAAGGPPVALEASSPETVLGLAARGAGVAVVSASMVADDLVAVPLASDVSCRLGLVWREGGVPSAAGRALLTAMRAALVPDRETGQGTGQKSPQETGQDAVGTQQIP